MATLMLNDVFDWSKAALMACGANDTNAASVAHSIREAEAEGLRNVGLGFLPYYCDHLLNGAIVGDAVPEIQNQGPGIVLVNGQKGLAHPAYDRAEAMFYEKAKAHGLAALCMRNVYYNGAVGYFVKRMAEQRLIGFACTNAMSMVAPFGGSKPFLGTNPLAFGVPRYKHPPLVVDLSTSTTAYINVVAAAQKGDIVPETWVLDRDGQPTVDPREGLEGCLQPLGGPKGTALGLMVEILAAGLSGGRWSYEMPPLSPEVSESPQVGQFYMAIDPVKFGRTELPSRLEAMLNEMLSQDGVRLPGDSRISARKRAEEDGVEVEELLYQKIVAYANSR